MSAGIAGVGGAGLRGYTSGYMLGKQMQLDRQKRELDRLAMWSKSAEDAMTRPGVHPATAEALAQFNLHLQQEADNIAAGKSKGGKKQGFMDRIFGRSPKDSAEEAPHGDQLSAIFRNAGQPAPGSARPDAQPDWTPDAATAGGGPPLPPDVSGQMRTPGAALSTLGGGGGANPRMSSPAAPATPPPMPASQIIAGTRPTTPSAIVAGSQPQPFSAMVGQGGQGGQAAETVAPAPPDVREQWHTPGWLAQNFHPPSAEDIQAQILEGNRGRMVPVDPKTASMRLIDQYRTQYAMLADHLARERGFGNDWNKAIADQDFMTLYTGMERLDPAGAKEFRAARFYQWQPGAVQARPLPPRTATEQVQDRKANIIMRGPTSEDDNAFLQREIDQKQREAEAGHYVSDADREKARVEIAGLRALQVPEAQRDEAQKAAVAALQQMKEFGRAVTNINFGTSPHAGIDPATGKPTMFVVNAKGETKALPFKPMPQHTATANTHLVEKVKVREQDPNFPEIGRDVWVDAYSPGRVEEAHTKGLVNDQQLREILQSENLNDPDGKLRAYAVRKGIIKSSLNEEAAAAAQGIAGGAAPGGPAAKGPAPAPKDYTPKK